MDVVKLSKDEVQAVREEGMRKQIWWVEDKGKIAQRFSRSSIWCWDAGNDLVVLVDQYGHLHRTYQACVLRNHNFTELERTKMVAVLPVLMRQVSEIYADGGEL